MCMLHFKTEGCDYCTPENKDFEFKSDETFIQVKPKSDIEHDSNYSGLDYATGLRLHVSSFGEPLNLPLSYDWQFVVAYERSWSQELDIRISGAGELKQTIEVPAYADDELWMPVKYCPWCGRDLEKTVLVKDNDEKVEVTPWVSAF